MFNHWHCHFSLSSHLLVGWYMQISTSQVSNISTAITVILAGMWGNSSPWTLSSNQLGRYRHTSISEKYLHKTYPCYHGYSSNLYNYFIRSRRLIQNIPWLAPWGNNCCCSWGVHLDDLSDQSPFHDCLDPWPCGLRNFNSLDFTNNYKSH